MDIPKAPCADIKDEERRVGELIHLTATYSAEEEKAVVQKIDMIILPFVRSSSPIHSHCAWVQITNGSGL